MSSSDVALDPLSSMGGVDSGAADSRNPFEILDDLMQVVEALCPTWPSREPFPDTATFVL